jgi:hypothetical protein
MAYCSSCGHTELDSSRFCSACGAALSPTPTPAPAPQAPHGTVGPYRLVAMVGHGASGVVWLGYGPDATPLAIKALAPELRNAPGFLERFRTEAQVLGALDHPNVVALHDYLETEDGAWVVMEFVVGASLRVVEERAGSLTPEQALGMLVGALAGLGYAHGRGLVHGDLKPENVLVDTKGTSKLADFGQVALTGTTASVAGTPVYMSPEAARAQVIDQRSDIYSAGVVLYEALAGVPPFVASSDFALLRMQVYDDPPPIASLAAPVDLLVRRALAKDPARRPQSAAAFATELAAAARASYGADWVTRASVVAAVAGATVTAASLLGSGSAAPAVVGGTTVAGAATTPGPAAPPSPGRLLTKLRATKAGTSFASHPIAATVLSAVVVAGAATGGVVGARGGAPAKPVTSSSHSETTVPVPPSTSPSVITIPPAPSSTSSTTTNATTSSIDPAASASIAQAYNTLFDLANPSVANKLAVIENGASLQQAMTEAESSRLSTSSGGATVTNVTLLSDTACQQTSLSSPCAKVVYDIVGTTGSVVLPGNEGYAVLINGNWLVAKVTICQLLGLFYTAAGKTGTPPGC